MDVQILEFTYDGTNVGDIESQLSGFLEHHDVHDVQVTQDGSTVLAFVFIDA